MEQRNTNDDQLVGNGESSANHEEETGSANAVFNNPLLMDKIVKYSIYKTNGKQINTQAILPIRLVNKSWLQSASRIFKKSGDWTMDLTFLPSYLDIGFYVTIHHTISLRNVDHFISVFSTGSRSIDSVLPMCLTIDTLRLTKDKCKKISKFFEECGDIISGLWVKYPIDEVSVTLNWNTFYFPILQTFKFQFGDLRNLAAYYSEDNFSQKRPNGQKCLQQFLQNSPSLRKFILVNFTENTGPIVIPATTREIKLCSPLNNSLLTVLEKTSLPNLMTLDLVICKEDEVLLMYKTLERFYHQLTILLIDVDAAKDLYANQNKSRVCIELPIMEKLKSLTISGEGFYLIPQFKHNWSTSVPNLSRLVFKTLQVFRESVLLEWIQGSRFENVRKLQFLPNCIDIERQCIMSSSVEMIREIITSFPNIEKLTLKIRFVETSGLKYLFQNFRQLKRLHLDFEFKNLDASTGCKMVSLFLGISLELATSLVDKTEENIKVPTVNARSIMNLKALNSLTLSTPKFNCPGRVKNPLCMDVISKYGLEKMPKLEKIKLLGGFEIQQ